MDVEEKPDNEKIPLRWKDILIVFCIVFHNIIVGANMTGPAYYNYRPNVTCKDFNLKSGCSSITDVCSCTTGNQTFVCHNFEYRGERGEISIVTEWNLICNNERYDTLSQTSYFIAIAIGSLAAGMLIDACGRKLVMFSCVFVQALLGTITSIYAHTYLTYITLQFIKGLFVQGIFISMYPLISELLPPGYGAVIACIIEVFWGLGVIILSIIFYLLPNWRNANLIISLGPLAVTVVSVWVVPESKKWREMRKTIIKNNVNKRSADAIALNENKSNTDIAPSVDERTATNTNDKNRLSKQTETEETAAITLLPRNHRESEIKTNQAQKSSGSIIYLLKTLFLTPRLRNHLFMMMFLWFTDAMSYFGITFFIPELSGNHYINISGGMLLEIIIFLILCLIVSKFGGKKTMCTTYFIGAICFIFAAFLPKGYFQTALAVAGKASIIGNYMCLLLCTIQLFPIQLQGIGIGIGNFSGQVGVMFAPFMKSLADHVWFGAPFILSSVLYLTCCTVVYFIVPDDSATNVDSDESITN